MPLQKKVVKREKFIKGCESCLHRSGDFWNDEVYPDIVRAYCKARHVNVDAEAMSRDCDFFKLSPDYVKPEENNRYGL